MTMEQTTIASTVIEHQAADLSIISLIAGADIVVKLVLLILVAASIWSWAIIIDKSFLLRKIAKQIDEFERVFWSGQMLDQLYDKVRHKVEHPLSAIFVVAMDEWSRQKLSSNQPKNVSYLSISLKDRINQAMEITKNQEIDTMSKNLSFLAIVGSSATFVGLFGTVWGILTSFKSIAVMKNASIAVVAPGIAEALFATAIGLVAAIPAMVFYSLFASKINVISNKIEGFATELSSLLSQEIDRGLDQHANEYK